MHGIPVRIQQQKKDYFSTNGKNPRLNLEDSVTNRWAEPLVTGAKRRLRGVQKRLEGVVSCRVAPGSIRSAKIPILSRLASKS